jgi:hypothetical protein
MRFAGVRGALTKVGRSLIKHVIGNNSLLINLQLL